MTETKRDALRKEINDKWDQNFTLKSEIKYLEMLF